MLIIVETTNATNASLFGDWFMLLLLTAIAVFVVARFSGTRNDQSAASSTPAKWQNYIPAFNYRPRQTPASIAKPAPVFERRPAPDAGRMQWDRLTDIIGTAGISSSQIDSYQRRAKIQLDAAELSLSRVLAEIATVMPLPVESAIETRGLAGATASASFPHSIAA